MIFLDDRIDCPECGAAGSVARGYCEVCSAEVPEPAAHPAPFPRLPILHPSIPLRFADVIEELRTIASMAERAGQVQGGAVQAACRRAESLLIVLRRQFLEDVTISSLDGPGTSDPSRAGMFTSRSSSGRGRFTSPG